MNKSTNWKIVLPFLILIWALVGVNRMATSFLGPFIIEEFGLTLEQFGWVVAVVAFTWATGSLFSGFLANRFGTKPIIIFGGLFSALFGWLSGMVVSLAALLGVRAALGVAEGSLWAPLITASSRMAPQKMKAKIVGFFFVSFLLLGMVIGAPLLTKIGTDFGWRKAFFIVSLPLLVVTLVVTWLMKEPVIDVTTDEQSKPSIKESIKNVIRYRNIYISAGVAICLMGQLFLVMNFGIIFLEQVHGVSVADGGKIIGPAILANIVGVLVAGAIADKTGKRRGIIIPSLFFAIIGLALFALLPKGTPLGILITCLCFSFFFSGGPAPIAVGIIPEETVKPIYAAAAIGLTNFLGEFVGGGIFPIIGGTIGDQWGVKSIMILATVMVGLSLLLSFLLKETKPKSE